MYKIAAEFFANQQVKLPKDSPFEKTDLYVFLRMMFGVAPIKSTQGLLKVVDRGDHWIIAEHIYYDYFEGEEAFYYSLPGLELTSSKIKNCERGKNLSKNGYVVLERNDEEYLNVVGLMPKIKYNQTPEYQGLGEPYATFKFNDRIWMQPDQKKYVGIEKEFHQKLHKILNEMIDYSDVLNSLDTFDMNILEWRDGRDMEAHNGVDYRSFINLIVYNTDHCQKTRTISVGEYDWYEKTFQALATNDYEGLMNIREGKVLKDEIEVKTNKAVLISVFNPKFYHQVGKMMSTGSLYVCTANKSFKCVVDRFDFNW